MEKDAQDLVDFIRRACQQAGMADKGQKPKMEHPKQAEPETTIALLTGANTMLQTKVKKLEEQIALLTSKNDVEMPIANLSPGFGATLVNLCLYVGGDLTEMQEVVNACYRLIGMRPPNLWKLKDKRELKDIDGSFIGKEHNGK